MSLDDLEGLGNAVVLLILIPKTPLFDVIINKINYTLTSRK